MTLSRAQVNNSLRWRVLIKVFCWSVIDFNDRRLRSSFSEGIQFAPYLWRNLNYSRTLQNAHLGDERKCPLVFLKDPTRALLLALAKSIYQPLKLLTPTRRHAFFTEQVHGCRRPKTPPEAFSSFDNFSDKIDEKNMELFLLRHLNRNFSGIVSGNSPTLEYNISVFFDKRWYLWIASVNYWTHQSSQQLAREEQLFLMWLTRENKHLGLSNHCLVLTWPEKLIALFLAVSSFIETRQTMNFNVKYFLFATSLFYIFLYFSGEKYLYKM